MRVQRDLGAVTLTEAKREYKKLKKRSRIQARKNTMVYYGVIFCRAGTRMWSLVVPIKIA